jgi:hypothetical protein
MLTCVLNCYNGVAPDGGAVPEAGSDQCASYCQLMNVGAVSVRLYMVQDQCQNSGLAGTVCNGLAPTAPCNCN